MWGKGWDTPVQQTPGGPHLPYTTRPNSALHVGGRVVSCPSLIDTKVEWLYK